MYLETIHCSVLQSFEFYISGIICIYVVYSLNIIFLNYIHVVYSLFIFTTLGYPFVWVCHKYSFLLLMDIPHTHTHVLLLYTEHLWNSCMYHWVHMWNTCYWAQAFFILCVSVLFFSSLFPLSPPSFYLLYPPPLPPLLEFKENECREIEIFLHYFYRLNAPLKASCFCLFLVCHGSLCFRVYGLSSDLEFIKNIRNSFISFSVYST